MNMLKQGYNGLKFSALTLAVGLVIGVSCAYAQTVSDPVAPEDPFAALNQQAQTNQPQAVQPQFAPMGNTLPTANQNTLQGYSLTPEEAAELEARMEEQAAERKPIALGLGAADYTYTWESLVGAIERVLG